jgi:hypothetical protein
MAKNVLLKSDRTARRRRVLPPLAAAAACGIASVSDVRQRSVDADRVDDAWTRQVYFQTQLELGNTR